jgi:hypothetical protein
VACSDTLPVGSKQLNNPQFVYMAHGTCKDDSCDTDAVPKPATVKKVASIVENEDLFKKQLSTRIGTESAELAADKIKLGATQEVTLEGKQKSIVQGLSLCKSVGLTAKQCLGTKFSN